MTFFKNYKFLVSFLFIPVVGVLISFNTRPDDEKPVQKTYKTEYVIVLIIDGPRMSETFGDST
ncbi:MAG: hypothetical protein NWQ47_05020, partial [Crocinitomicaceae bacterium]|nr:hypothetical protein [Crocinitomicaceae bacterium]